MYCNMCGKNLANIHYTQVVNDKIVELHLCEGCAKKKGISMQEPFSVSDFLGNISDFKSSLEYEQEKGFKCNGCGLTFKDFKENGRLGCSQCYDKFKDALRSILKRVHGSDKHVGNSSEDVSVKRSGDVPEAVKDKKDNKIIELKRALKKAIELEEYEKAAKIRDEIKKLV